MPPSDPGYTPACTDERVLASPFYQRLLSTNMDPYAAHSRNEQLIAAIESDIAN